MEYKYSKTNYLKLLKYAEPLKEEGKSLSKEKNDEYLNLLNSSIIFDGHKEIYVTEFISQLFEQLVGKKFVNRCRTSSTNNF